MKVVAKGEMISSKKNFRNVDGKKVDILIERVIKKIKNKLKK